MPKRYIALVQQTRKGHRGRFAIATSDEIEGSITFSLLDHVWNGDEEPEPGTLVVLSDLIRKKAGWRAHKARYLTPDDLQQSNKAKSKQLEH